MVQNIGIKQKNDNFIEFNFLRLVFDVFPLVPLVPFIVVGSRWLKPLESIGNSSKYRNKAKICFFDVFDVFIYLFVNNEPS